MIKKGIFLIGLIAFVLTSCIEHEVIPPPEPKVDLYAHFYGEINGAQVELTENVLGYVHSTSKAKILLPPPSFSSAVYYAEIHSSQVMTAVKLGMGSVNWDASISAEPSLNAFNGFFLANLNPAYSNDGTNGFEVTYRDGTGREWKSKETSVNFMDVEFTGVEQESDNSGDYSKFICNFECYAYSLNPDSLALPIPVLWLDSIRIQNAIYEGWFQR